MIHPFFKIFFLLLSFLMIVDTYGNTPFLFGNNKKPSFEQKESKKPHKKNPLLDKSYEELKKGKDQAIQNDDLSTAIKYLDALRIVSNDETEKRDFLLEIGDLYSKQEEWIKAEKTYEEFVLLNPGAARCDYAHYKSITCSFNQTLTVDRDQTKTQETLNRAQEFITLYKKSDHLENVQKLIMQCREKLLASDVNIFNFHLNSKNYKAAARRLDIINKEYIPSLPSAHPQALELSIQLAQAQNNTQQLLHTQLQLVQKYPDHDITKSLAIDLPTIQTQLALLEQKTYAVEPTLIAQFEPPLIESMEQTKFDKLAKQEQNIVPSPGRPYIDPRTGSPTQPMDRTAS